VEAGRILTIGLPADTYLSPAPSFDPAYGRRGITSEARRWHRHRQVWPTCYCLWPSWAATPGRPN